MRTIRPSHARPLALFALVAGAVLLILLSAAPAIATTPPGQQVWQGKDMAGVEWQGETQVADNYVVWTQKDGILGAAGYQYQVYLADLATGAFIKLHNDMATEQHDAHVAVQDDGTITVVWGEATSDPYHNHIWIWQGTEDPGVRFIPTPDPSAADPDNPTSAFPRALVMGRYDSNDLGDPIPVECDQSFPAIGLVNEPGAANKHLIVAWEDYRDFGIVPQIYYADLSGGVFAADSNTVLWDTGMAIDMTDVAARGERGPEVGPKGVFWLDDRYTFWTNWGEMFGTDVRFSDFTSGGPDGAMPSVALYDDTSSSNDNAGLITTGTGAAWLHSGPYPDGRAEPFAAKVAGKAALLTSATIPNGYRDRTLSCAWAPSSTSSSYFALTGLHGDSANGDEDIFFYDPSTGARMPVCDRGMTNYDLETPAGRTGKFNATSNQPAIGLVPDPAKPGSFLGFERVVWADSQLNTVVDPEENGQAQLFEAFVPRVSLRASRTSLLRLHSGTLTVTVSPIFGGLPVTLQLVKAMPALGKPSRLVKTVATKNLSSSSKASFTWKPTLKGTYYLRASFGGSPDLYYADGTKTQPASGFDYHVPFVANVSKVVKIVVK